METTISGNGKSPSQFSESNVLVWAVGLDTRPKDLCSNDSSFQLLRLSEETGPEIQSILTKGRHPPSL